MIIDGSFGGILKMIRIHNGLTLRKMCLLRKYDAGNYSKMERGLLPPPSNKKSVMALIKDLDTYEVHEELLVCAAFNFHLGKLQERFKQSRDEIDGGKDE